MPGENVTQQQLRTRSWWSGPDIYLIIDDYDLVAGASGNPLAPLADSCRTPRISGCTSSSPGAPVAQRVRCSIPFSQGCANSARRG